jgi:transcription elongation factor Elf1
MGNYSYITCRTLQNKSGEEKGKLKVFVRTGSETAEGEYECPECGDRGKVDQVFKRPLNVKCSKCGFLMKAPKLKGKK